MLKYLIAATVIACGGCMLIGTALAAEPSSKPAVQRHAALNLTDEQKARIHDIIAAARADAKKADTREARLAILKAAWEKVRTDVLTDEQRARVDQARSRLGALREAARQRAGEAMSKALGLTEQQKQSVHDILSAARTKAAAATTPQEKTAIMRNAFADIKANVLTAEQREKFDAVRDQCKQRLDQFRQKMHERIRQRMHEHMGHKGATSSAPASQP